MRRYNQANKLIFDFASYKEALISFYCNGSDAARRAERQAYIECFYSDAFLLNIIVNTQNFIDMLVPKMAATKQILDNNIFLNLERAYDSKLTSEVYLSNNCSGGWPADVLFFMDAKKELISLRLLKKFFGPRFRISLDEEPFEGYNEEEDVGYEFSIPILAIVGPYAEFEKIYHRCRIEKALKTANVMRKKYPSKAPDAT